MSKYTVTLSNANGALVTETYESLEAARAAVRRMGGKRLSRAAATPRSLSYYELPNGSQACVAELLAPV